MIYTWPDGDDSYMKLIRATKASGMQFRALISRFHPIGDFDSPGASIPDEPARIYRTARGLRVFFTDRYGEPPGCFLRSLVPSGLDPMYAKVCEERGYYAVRVDPKTQDPAAGGFAVATLLAQEGTIRPEWEKIISVHDEMTNALIPGAVLV